MHPNPIDTEHLEDGDGDRLLRSLQERARSATGADREIDYDLHVAFGRDSFVSGMISGVRTCEPGWHEGESADAWTILFDDGSGSSRNCGVTKWTASIDAALALVERCLPGWRYCIFQDPSGFRVRLAELPRIVPGRGHSSPLAILDAMLSALIANSTNTRKPGEAND